MESLFSFEGVEHPFDLRHSLRLTLSGVSSQPQKAGLGAVEWVNPEQPRPSGRGVEGLTP